MPHSTTHIGSRGEELAVEWLRREGFYIVERNWRINYYEVDIIAQRWDTIHFVEVKTRHEGGWQSSFDSINEQKIRSMRRTAAAYRAINHLPHLVQFDLISIVERNDGSHTLDYTENII